MFLALLKLGLVLLVTDDHSPYKICLEDLLLLLHLHHLQIFEKVKTREAGT